MVKVISLAIEIPEKADNKGCLGKALGALVEACREAGLGNGWPEFEMAESPWDVELKAYGSLSLELNDCREGRLFGKAAELRWRRKGTRVVAVLIADQDISVQVNGLDGVTLGEERSLDEHERRDAHLLLWGEKRDAGGAWREGRIPRALDYPLAGNGQPCLRVREYLDERGVAEFGRFVAVEVKQCPRDDGGTAGERRN